MGEDKPANRRPAPRTLWAYVYEIIPPQDEDRFRAIEALLDHEQSEARKLARTWTGRFVLERQVARILVVTDAPEQNRENDHRLEAELKVLDAAFSKTPAIAITGVPAQAPAGA